MAVPPAAVAILWKTGFSTFGWINNILITFNLIEAPILWMTAKGFNALLFLILIDTWTVLPSVMIILLAGLQNLNKEYEEAGLIFGANKFQVTKDIVMPILKPTIVTAIILRMIAAIQIWMISVMMFGYGRVPFLVERIAYYTDVVPMLDESYKMSLTYSVIVTIIVMLSVVLYLKVSKKNKEEVEI
jgi:multiple sugar transport system permease protein